MAHLLHIEASPRKQRSASIDVARHFLSAYQRHHPGATIETLDLWAKPLPEFDGDMLEAKYAVMSGQTATPAQAAAWDAVKAMAAPLHAADRIVVSTPMWNFGIPYRLKHWIDIVVQPGITFGFDPAKGYFGLVTGKKALMICAQGGDYTQGSPAAAMDLQTRYLSQVLAFIGISEQATLVVPRGLHGPDSDRASRDAAKAEATRLAATF